MTLADELREHNKRTEMETFEDPKNPGRKIYGWHRVPPPGTLLYDYLTGAVDENGRPTERCYEKHIARQAHGY